MARWTEEGLVIHRWTTGCHSDSQLIHRCSQLRRFLCAGRRNRLLAFRGDLLHGVVPGAGVGSTHRKGRRVTFMIAFWRRLTVQDRSGHGSARPFFQRCRELPWASALITRPPSTTTTTHKKPTKPAKRAFFQVPLWEDVDYGANGVDGVTLDDLAAAGTMPAYDAFFQFA